MAAKSECASTRWEHGALQSHMEPPPVACGAAPVERVTRRRSAARPSPAQPGGHTRDDADHGPDHGGWQDWDLVAEGWAE